jgi:excisionase family DNA binding protein
MTEQRVFLTVKDVAARLGVHPETIRRWERQGVIAPAMRRRGVRVYREEDVAQIERAVFQEARSPNGRETKHRDPEYARETGIPDPQL